MLGYCGRKDLRDIKGYERGLARLAEIDAYCIDVVAQAPTATVPPSRSPGAAR